jgi:RNA polymerase sigma-70 factor, ECF subfamily
VDEQAFEQLVAQHYPRIRRAALLLSNGNAWEADDLAQETLLRAAEGWSRFAGKSLVETWLYSILLNCHHQRLRSLGRRWRHWMQWFFREDRAVVGDSADAAALEDEFKAGLWGAVGKLSEPLREVVVLRFAEGLAYEEIAAAVRCPLGTVKSRIHNALIALQKELAEHARP